MLQLSQVKEVKELWELTSGTRKPCWRVLWYSSVLSNLKVMLHFTGSVGNRIERLMILIHTGPEYYLDLRNKIQLYFLNWLNFPSCVYITLRNWILYFEESGIIHLNVFLLCLCFPALFYNICGSMLIRTDLYPLFHRVIAFKNSN